MMSSNHHVFNLTFQLNKEIIEPWLKEMTNTILPKVVDGEVILSADLRKVILEQEEVPSYAVQFLFPSLKMFNTRKLERLSILIELMDKSFANKYVYFGTLMEMLHRTGMNTSSSS